MAKRKRGTEDEGPPPILPGARERLEAVLRDLEHHEGPHGEFDLQVEYGAASIGGWMAAAPVDDFVQAVYDYQVFYPFDWSEWLDTEEGRALKDQPDALQKADSIILPLAYAPASLALDELKPDWPFRRGRLRHQLSDGIEHDPKVRVVLALQGGEFAGELGVGLQHLAEAHERAHDLDVHRHGLRAPEDGREHRHSLFSEGVGKVAPAASPV
jgi:hypothetical protein